jgi:hypothetical protein
MSKVEQYSRPWVTFNPTDKQHREIFHTALKYNTWGKAPVRFWLEGETSSLMDQCTQKMARYYMEQEFGKIKDKLIAEEINVINQYRFTAVVV